MRIWTAFVMAGAGFTVGFLCGLLIHLPAESLPTNAFAANHLGQIWKVAQVDMEVRSQRLKLDNTSSNKPANSFKIETNSQHMDIVDVGSPSLIDDNSKMVTRDIYNKPNSVVREPTNSVVYVNPDKQKIVLSNENDNDTSQFRRGLVGDYRLDKHLVPTIPNAMVVGVKQYAFAGDFVTKYDVVKHKDTTDIPNYRKGFISSINDVVVEGVFWSESVENYCPNGFSKADYDNWKIKATNENFVSMNEGCGRMQNRLLTFSTSEKACGRYRINTDQIQGEIYSYHLSKLLGINNVVPSVLQLANSNKDKWRIIAQDVANAQWSEEKPVIVAKWIDGLSPAYIPVEFRNLTKVLHSKDVIEKVRLQGDKLDNVNDGTSVCELFQWSDLIIFDYLTANLDRVVNNLFNLQWNDRMMSKPAHNLEKGPHGNLVFLDNESGLFHGYRLLDKYSSFHENLLNSLCVFRKQTIKSISHFVETGSIGDALQSVFEENEPLHRHLPRIPGANIKILKRRMDKVLRQVNKCASENA